MLGDFSRQVIVPASALERGGSSHEESGDSYIDPSVMMSQHTYMSKARVGTGAFHMTSTDVSSQSSYNHIGGASSSAPSASSSADSDLMSMLSQMKGSAKSGTTTLGRQQSQKSKSIADIFDKLGNASSGPGEHRESNYEQVQPKVSFPVSEKSLQQKIQSCVEPPMPTTARKVVSTASTGLKRRMGLSSADDFSSCDSSGGALSHGSSSSQVANPGVRTFGLFGRLADRNSAERSISSESDQDGVSRGVPEENKTNRLKELVGKYPTSYIQPELIGACVGELKAELSASCYQIFKTKVKGVLAAIKQEGNIDVSRVSGQHAQCSSKLPYTHMCCRFEHLLIRSYRYCMEFYPLTNLRKLSV